MSIRVRLSRQPWFRPIAVIGWQIGLGWLLGRWFVLLTTIDGRGERRHSVVPFAFASGDIYVSAQGGEPWVADASRKPLAMAQAHPGPLGVSIREATADERGRVDSILARYAPDLLDAGAGPRRYVLAASGDPTPTLVPPDHVWVWPAAAAAAFLMRRIGSR